MTGTSLRTSIAVILVSLGLGGCARDAAVTAGPLTGRLVDSACYAKDKSNTGMTHKGMGHVCAEVCAREGFPVWLVTPDGAAYQLEGELASNNNEKLIPYMGHTVRLVGDVQDNGDRKVITSANIEIVKE